MSDTVIIFGLMALMVIVIVIIVMMFRANERQFDRNNVGQMPDFPIDGLPDMKQVTNHMDARQVSDKQFKQMYGMTRDDWVEQYGGWESYSLWDQFVSGHISEKEYAALSKQEFTKRGAYPPDADVNTSLFAALSSRRNKKKNSVVAKSVYRKVEK